MSQNNTRMVLRKRKQALVVKAENKNRSKSTQTIEEVPKVLIPQPDVFQGTVTLRVPVKLPRKKIMFGQTIDIGGFQWQIGAKIENYSLKPELHCNINNGSSLWVCKTLCNFGILDNDNTTMKLDLYKHIFNASSPTLTASINRSWSDLVTNESLMTDGHLTFLFNIEISLDAGFRTFTPLDFSCSSQYSDVILLVGGRKFHVNRAIIAMQSPFFHSLFYADFMEKNKREVILYGVDPVEFEEFLNVIYPSAGSVTDANYLYILKLADMFQANSVIKTCEDFICKYKRFDTINTILISEKYGLAKVVDVCISTIHDAARVKTLAEHPNYVNISVATKMDIFSILLTY